MGGLLQLVFSTIPAGNTGKLFGRNNLAVSE